MGILFYQMRVYRHIDLGRPVKLPASCNAEGLSLDLIPFWLR